MSPALAAEIVEFSHESDKPLYRATLGAVAEIRKVRPVFLERQPRAQRSATLVASLARPALEPAAGNLIRGWLVNKQSAMLAQFLDALEIKHEKGVVEDLPATVDDAKLRAAVDGLLANRQQEVVAVYLLAFHEMNQANWPNLKTMLETEPRLQLGNHS
ncbi:MAG TPA: hypothetical protein VN048_18390 [Verrucomicrobiae bacterium]|nr:hypothetical protein [Verrucomicrobiae bacterium]